MHRLFLKLLYNYLLSFLDRFLDRNLHSYLPSCGTIDSKCRFFFLHLDGWLFLLFFDQAIISKSLLRYAVKFVLHSFFEVNIGVA